MRTNMRVHPQLTNVFSFGTRNAQCCNKNSHTQGCQLDQVVFHVDIFLRHAPSEQCSSLAGESRQSGARKPGRAYIICGHSSIRFHPVWLGVNSRRNSNIEANYCGFEEKRKWPALASRGMSVCVNSFLHGSIDENPTPLWKAIISALTRDM